MSHVATIDLQVKDLAALKAACAKLGLELVEGQKTHKWYGRWVNDYSAQDAAYRNGIDPKDYGKCEHAIRIPGNASAYEIGVVADKAHPGSYRLIWDNFMGGKGLDKIIGNDTGLLKQRYAAEVARKQALRQGYRVIETQTADGKILLRAKR